MTNDPTGVDHENGVPRNPGAVERSKLPLPVVGLGASAGGLTALKQFFEQMPKRSGLTFVVILHLSPRHESMADKILQAVTAMPVEQVEGSTPLEPDHVYVISPNHDLLMSDGRLRVTPADRPRGGHVAIDLFFRTLADTHQDKAVGVVLSGTGADGAVGIARIKEQGGITFAQAPEDAEYDDMPRHAIATGQVDFVLPVAEIPDKLMAWWRNARAIRLPAASTDGTPLTASSLDRGEDAERALREVLEMLAARSGHDFRHYKRATVLRRIERRMQINLLKDVPAYREFLKSHPEETRALLDDMLIGVTNFFRDREAFEALERGVIPEICHATLPPDQVRVWVPGCASGEEAYSIAMLLADQAENQAAPPSFQVFASDIDEAAIAHGRAGLYPESILADVPPARLRQFFTKQQQHYRIDKTIRDRVLFALHNVLRDPPFSRVDLISCRNLLIYLDREVQARLLEIFHFALRPGGLLFLGSSESADATPAHFEAVDKRHRVYRARALVRSARPVSTMPMRTGGVTAAADPALPREPRGFTFADVHQRVVEYYAPPSVIIDRDFNLLHLSENVGRFLRFAGGEPSRNLIAVADPALRTELRTTLFQAIHSNKSVEARVKIEQGGKQPRFVNVIARPFRDPDAGADFVLVLFDEVEDALGANLENTPAGAGKSHVLQNMEEELQRTRERLQATIEQYETSHEELKASNEELQAINEELRSASEELETSKEELQSVNEELTTVNFELKAKVEEAAKLNDDLQNFITSTDIATVFVDAGLRIKRYTPRIADMFNIIPGDVGRSLLDITNRLDYPQLAADATAAFEALQLIEREVRSSDGRWYLARVLPYRTASNRIDGAVLTFMDTEFWRGAESRISHGESQMRMAAQVSSEHAIIVLDEHANITAWNSGAQQLFGWSAAEMRGQSLERIFTPEDVEANVLATELAGAQQAGHIEEQRWHVNKRGDRVFCSGVLSHFATDKFHAFVKIVRDATQRELRAMRGDDREVSGSELRREAEAASAMKDDFLAVVSHELKNPLNLISVNAELLARLQEDHPSESVDVALDKIRRAVRGQTKIIDDLLDMSRIRTGKLELNIEAVDLGAAARSVIDTVSVDVSSDGLELSCRQPVEPVVVHADAGRLEQIVWNLVSNAVKFTPRGGRIDVQISVEGDFGRLTVKDTGQGIDPHFVARAFELFGQAPARALNGKGGLGIGLALVKQLVERQGGRIDVESPGIGKGSSFSVWLPRFDYDVIAPVRDGRAGRESGQWQGLKVLLVDDSAESADTLAQLLELQGATVAVAHDGAEALAVLAKAPFDIVFADVGMPNMDGYEFAQSARALPRGKDVPLVALTGFTRPGDVQRALQAGFDSHIGKPVTVQALTKALQQALTQYKVDRGEK